MMSLTLDILLMNDPSSGSDKTGEWEHEIDRRSSPKKKFPLKIRTDLSDLNSEFKDPEVSDPPKRKSEMKKEARVVETGKSKNRSKSKDKTKLF